MDHETERERRKPVRILRPRIVWTIVRTSGLLPVTVSFIAVFIIVSVIVAKVEPAIPTIADAAWFLYTVIITIGLGDYTCVTTVGRLAAIVLSLYSVFYLALITGTVVSYCNERMKLEHDESVAAFIDQLERLPELSHEELVDVSERIKHLRK